MNIYNVYNNNNNCFRQEYFSRIGILQNARLSYKIIKMVIIWIKLNIQKDFIVRLLFLNFDIREMNVFFNSNYTIINVPIISRITLKGSSSLSITITLRSKFLAITYWFKKIMLKVRTCKIHGLPYLYSKYPYQNLHNSWLNPNVSCK